MGDKQSLRAALRQAIEQTTPYGDVERKFCSDFTLERLKALVR